MIKIVTPNTQVRAFCHIFRGNQRVLASIEIGLAYKKDSKGLDYENSFRIVI